MDPYHRYASLLRVLSHPSRLNLLDLLRDRELTLEEIQGWIDLDLAALHRHLMLLRQAGLVKDRREGRTAFYQADEAVSDALFTLFELQEARRVPEQALFREPRSAARLT